MIWFLTAISAYCLFAISSLLDRYLLVGPLPHPRVYAFYGGLFGIITAFFLVPFGFQVLPWPQIGFAFLAGTLRIFALWALYFAIFKSEVSRVVPAISGFLPIFSFFLFLIFFPSLIIPNFWQILSLIFLILGSVLISLNKPNLRFLSFKNLKYPILAAALFAGEFFLIKLVYLNKELFLPGFIWMRFFGAVPLVFFLISADTRKLILKQKPINQKLILIPFIFNQGLSGLAYGLQNFAVFTANPGQVPLINALEGIKHVFLLSFIFVLSKKFPHLLKEEMKGKALLQKVLAVFLIIIGLIFLTKS